MAKNKFTEEQTAALEARGKAIVSASAGSGKTTVMIEKIVRLILGGADVSEILAVTFTKKAAQQMKDKLKSALVKAVNSEGTPVSDLHALFRGGHGRRFFHRFRVRRAGKRIAAARLNGAVRRVVYGKRSRFSAFVVGVFPQKKGRHVKKSAHVRLCLAAR